MKRLLRGSFCARNGPMFCTRAADQLSPAPDPLAPPQVDPLGPRAGKLFDSIFYTLSAPVPPAQVSKSAAFLLEKREELKALLDGIPVAKLPLATEHQIQGLLQFARQTIDDQHKAHTRKSSSECAAKVAALLDASYSEEDFPMLPTSAEVQRPPLLMLQLAEKLPPEPGLARLTKTFAPNCNEGSLVTLIHNCGRLGRGDVSLRLFASAPRHNERFCGALLHAFTVSKNMDHAEWLIEEMKAMGLTPNIVHWTMLLQGYCIQHNKQALWRVYEGMRRYASIDPDEMVFSIMIRACADDGLVERGLGLFEEMEQVYKLVPLKETYLALLRLLGKRQDLLRELDEMFQRMEGYGFKPDSDVFFWLIHGAGRYGDIHRVRRYLEKMARLGVTPTVSIFGATMAAYANTLRETSEFSKQCWAKGERPNKVFVRAEVDRLFLDMQKPPHSLKPNALCLHALLASRTLGPEPDPVVAKKILLETFKEHGIIPGAKAYDFVITMFARLDKVDLCEATFSGMIKRDIEPLPSTAYRIAQAHIRSGEPDSLARAFKWVDLLEARGYPLTPVQVDILKTLFRKYRYKRELKQRIKAAAVREGLDEDAEPLKPPSWLPELTTPRALAERQAQTIGDKYLSESSTTERSTADEEALDLRPSIPSTRAKRTHHSINTLDNKSDDQKQEGKTHYKFRDVYWGIVDVNEDDVGQKPSKGKKWSKQR
eukprot:TRINITY_DN10332_c0_g1_i2.p1 TRINITY_DN10332_c0_g1~~TRINITY_DN10332_c0_g1_i2.p1  ORF type:complete len:712 (+),score=90.96 TRINITY_DN10332_c0_g1_i2:25-2160(+)